MLFSAYSLIFPLGDFLVFFLNFVVSDRFILFNMISCETKLKAAKIKEKSHQLNKKINFGVFLNPGFNIFFSLIYHFN